eukprot:CAMPEP_0172454666 /NCGR_PEP_ID=MMETSP1065-20121228/11588_1 /TAXON_ID=265537 /ORGANISM="Amphiprora paludosa, Strain CCMP125" /LENGTH=33 /DNA_ID= /DNA_START= /DNA_END= /DNA_ORIENTATION=
MAEKDEISGFDRFGDWNGDDGSKRSEKTIKTRA